MKKSEEYYKCFGYPKFSESEYEFLVGLNNQRKINGLSHLDNVSLSGSSCDFRDADARKIMDIISDDKDVPLWIFPKK